MFCIHVTIWHQTVHQMCERWKTSLQRVAGQQAFSPPTKCQQPPSITVRCKQHPQIARAGRLTPREIAAAGDRCGSNILMRIPTTSLLQCQGTLMSSIDIDSFHSATTPWASAIAVVKSWGSERLTASPRPQNSWHNRDSNPGHLAPHRVTTLTPSISSSEGHPTFRGSNREASGSGGWKSQSKLSAGWFLLRPLPGSCPWFIDGHRLSVSFLYVCLCTEMSPLCKHTNHIGLGPP